MYKEDTFPHGLCHISGRPVLGTPLPTLNSAHFTGTSCSLTLSKSNRLNKYLYSDRLNIQLSTSSAACLSPKRSMSSYGLVCGLSLHCYASELTLRSSFYCLSLFNDSTRVELMYRWISPLRAELSRRVNHLHTLPRRHLISASLPRNH